MPLPKKILRERYGVETLAYVKQVKGIVAKADPEKVRVKDIEANIVRCPDPATAKRMIKLIETVRRLDRRHRGVES